MKTEKAVSPVIATVLLILVVLILATIIFYWFQKGFVKEIIEKEIAGSTENVMSWCSKVSIRTYINNNGNFGYINEGNVPIYSVKLKLVREGSSEVVTVSGQLNPGFSSKVLEDPSGDAYVYGDYEEIKIIPVLLGKKRNGETQEYPCPEENAILV